VADVAASNALMRDVRLSISLFKPVENLSAPSLHAFSAFTDVVIVSWPI
jgi:hypothetical protein